jgi:hypothetical protein
MIFQPAYFGPIIQYVALVNSKEIKFEVQDNYQKQTYRNRCYIFGANGKQMLNVPIIHSKSNFKQKTKEVKIDRSFAWSKLHLRSFQAAYRSSPFFEFYEDEIVALYNKNYKFLIDLNFESIRIVNDCLQIDFPIKKTLEYQKDIKQDSDFRSLVNAKINREYNLKKYTQVFDNNHGYISNLSILDLLFNEGTNALTYLEEHRDLFF